MNAYNKPASLYLGRTPKIAPLKVAGLRVAALIAVSIPFALMGQTAYGLFNGLTRYTSHVLKSSNKTFGNLMGNAASINSLGFDYFSQI